MSVGTWVTWPSPIDDYFADCVKVKWQQVQQRLLSSLDPLSFYVFLNLWHAFLSNISFYCKCFSCKQRLSVVVYYVYSVPVFSLINVEKTPAATIEWSTSGWRIEGSTPTLVSKCLWARQWVTPKMVACLEVAPLSVFEYVCAWINRSDCKVLRGFEPKLLFYALEFARIILIEKTFTVDQRE